MAQELERALEALRKADAAGNTEDAKALAGVVRRLQAEQAPEPSSNLLVGLANRGLGLIQGGVQAFDEAGKFMQRQIPLGGIDLDTGRYVSGRDIGEGRAQTDFGRVAEGIQETRDQSVPYAPAVTWDELKANRFPVADVARFIVDTGVVSTPDMIAAVTNLPGYVVARAGELAEERAAADGRDQVTGQDMLAALGTAAVAGGLERVGGRAVLQAIPGGRSVLGRVGSAAGREAGTEALQEVIENVGVTAGTETGFDPSRVPDLAGAGALAGGGYGGAVRTGIETVQGARRAGQAVSRNIARADVRANPDQVASDVRVADLYERRVRAIEQFDPEAKLETDVVFKDIGDTLERELLDAGRDLRRAGDIDREGERVIKDAIRAAKRHNRTLAEGGEDFALFETEVDRLRELGLDAESTETLVNTVRDLNTAIGSSLKKDRMGPMEAAARRSLTGLGAGGLGAAAGATIAGPPGAAIGALTAGTVGRAAATRSARAVDRALSLDQPQLLRRAQARREAADQLGMSVGDTVTALRALRQGAQARERLVAPQEAAEASPIDRVLRAQGIDRQGGWLRAITDQANLVTGAVQSGQPVTQQDVWAAIDQLAAMGALTQADYQALVDEPSGRITDDRVFYGIQDFVIANAGGAQAPVTPQTPTAGGLEGIRNVPSYMQTMRNVQAATQAALQAATSPEEQALVGEIANARSKAAKRAIAAEAAANFPLMRPFIETYVAPLTEFGPEAEPLKRSVKTRGRGGRPMVSEGIPQGLTDAILDRIKARAATLPTVRPEPSSEPTAVLREPPPPTAGIAARKEPVDIPATGKGGTQVTVADIGRFWDETHPGAIIQPTPSDLARLTDDWHSEVDFQLSQPITGENWYSQDVAKAFEMASHVVPEFGTNEDFRTLSTAAGAILSGGQKPGKNMENLITQMEYFAEFGRFSPVNPTNGKLWSGKQGKNQQQAFEGLNALLERFGSIEGLNDFLFQRHPVREVNAERLATGVWKGPATGMGKQNDLVLGMRMFGPKFTNFSLNLQGIDTEPTKDLWFSRTWNRHLGTMTGPGSVDSGSGLVDQPRNQRERDQQDAVVRELASRTGKSPSTIQAILWFFEQQLFDALGARSIPEAMSDGARRTLEQRGLDRFVLEQADFSRSAR